MVEIKSVIAIVLTSTLPNLVIAKFKSFIGEYPPNIALFAIDNIFADIDESNDTIFAISLLDTELSFSISSSFFNTLGIVGK